MTPPRYWEQFIQCAFSMHQQTAVKLEVGRLWGFEDEDAKAILVTSQPYTEMINELLSPNLPPNNGNLWFQQDGATAHMAVISSIAALRCLFPERAISRFGDVSWPLRSPDLTNSDFFLWGYLKCKVYITRPTDLNGLKANLRGKKSPEFQKKHFNAS